MCAVSLMCLTGCNARRANPIAPRIATSPIKRRSNIAATEVGRHAPEPIALTFHILAADVAASPGRSTWDATYTSNGKTARFRVELTAGTTKERGFFVPGSGCFYSVSGSDATGLLADLRPVLGAKHLPTNPKRVSKMPFDVAFLGVNQSKLPDTANTFGGFRSNPPGDWTVVKVFLPDDIEFFLNINSTAGKAEFSMKDDSYGDDILKELAKVL